MKQTLSDLHKVQSLLNFQKERYGKAIHSNTPFEEIRVIYLLVKELQEQEIDLIKRSMDIKNKKS